MLLASSFSLYSICMHKKVMWLAFLATGKQKLLLRSSFDVG
jgi:hypothetical protein